MKKGVQEMNEPTMVLLIFNISGLDRDGIIILASYTFI